MHRGPLFEASWTGGYPCLLMDIPKFEISCHISNKWFGMNDESSSRKVVK